MLSQGLQLGGVVQAAGDLQLDSAGVQTQQLLEQQLALREKNPDSAVMLTIIYK